MGMLAGKLPKLLKGNSRRIIEDQSKRRPSVELLPWPLYQRQQMPAAASQTLTFFRNIAGNSTLLDTNLTTAGILPWPHSFDLYQIAIVVEFGINEIDMNRFYNNAIFEFKLSQKPYFQEHVNRIPATCGFHGLATTNNVFNVQNGLPMPMNGWSMAISGLSLFIPHQQDFSAEIRTFNNVAFTVPFFVSVHLDGVLARPSL
jgi:hypothetical protein